MCVLLCVYGVLRCCARHQSHDACVCCCVCMEYCDAALNTNQVVHCPAPVHVCLHAHCAPHGADVHNVPASAHCTVACTYIVQAHCTVACTCIVQARCARLLVHALVWCIAAVCSRPFACKHQRHLHYTPGTCMYTPEALGGAPADTRSSRGQRSRSAVHKACKAQCIKSALHRACRGAAH